MPVLVEVIVVIIAIILLCSNLSLRADLKRTKDLFELSKSANNQLTEKLRVANLQIEDLKCGNGGTEQKKNKIPAFLLVDDPMDAVLGDVGKLNK